MQRQKVAELNNCCDFVSSKPVKTRIPYINVSYLYCIPIWSKIQGPVYDVIIGDGPIGLCTTDECSKAGKSVLALEQRRLAAEVTARLFKENGSLSHSSMKHVKSLS